MSDAHTDEQAIRFWPLTDVGRVRDHNEDAFLVDRKLNLFVVADGMGGHAAGEVASNLTVRVIRDALVSQRQLLADFEANAAARKEISNLLESAVIRACAEVHAEGQRDDSKRGMGTTVDALLIVGTRGFIAHVGDSRVYLYRQGSVHQLTEDHSLMNELLKRGRLTPEQIDKVQYKNAVTRAVGVYESVQPEVYDFDVLAGDRFLICTDGLHGYLEESEIARMFDENPVHLVSERFVALANERGGSDNITSIIVQVPDSESGVDKLAREVNLKLEILHRMPLFRSLTYKELVRVLNITGVRPYEAQQEVFGEGHEGDELFIVLSGRVKVHSGDTVLVELGPGEFFGEMALIDRAPRSAAVTASEQTDLLVVRRRDFFAMIKKDHDVAVKLLWSFLNVLSVRLRSTSQQLGQAREQLSMEDLTEELLGGLDDTEVTDLADQPPIPGVSIPGEGGADGEGDPSKG